MPLHFARRMTSGVPIISADIPALVPASSAIERFILRLAAYEPIEEPAREAIRQGVQAGPRVPAYETHRDNAPPELCILLDGWVCHFRLFGNGRRQITSVVVPGDLVDFGFLTGGASQLYYRATTTSRFGRLPVGQFASMAEEYPSLMRAALRASATESAIREERVMSLGVRSAVERVAHLFCELWHRLDVVGLVAPDNSYDLPMTQTELGETLGLSMVHVNRTLQALRRDGTITLSRGRVTLHQPERLVALSGFDPAYLGPASERILTRTKSLPLAGG